MNHEDRVSKVLSFLTRDMTPDWKKYSIPRIGTVYVSCMPLELSQKWGSNQCWARVGSMSRYSSEFRGTAQDVARKLVGLMRAPSRAVQATVDALQSKNFDGLKPYEAAAMFSLDTELTFRAFDLMIERGDLVRRGDMGWFRTNT